MDIRHKKRLMLVSNNLLHFDSVLFANPTIKCCYNLSSITEELVFLKVAVFNYCYRIMFPTLVHVLIALN